MGEVTDDTKTGTITLYTPCPTPTLSHSIISVVGMTVTVSIAANPGAGASWRSANPSLEWDDGTGENNVRTGTHSHTYTAPGTYYIGLTGYNNCGNHAESPGIEVTVSKLLTPAKGDIISIDVPASIQHGELVRIDLIVKNIGEMSGTFKLKYYFNGSLVVTSAPWVMAAGHQQAAGGQIYFAPTSGTSMTYKVKFMRVV